MANYLPNRESELVTWMTNFKTLIDAAPTDYGLTSTQASDYDALADAYLAAYQTANDPSTRTAPAIEAKDTAKAAVLAETRRLVRIAQAWPGMTNAKRSDLGITVPDTDPTPVPVPSEEPQLDVASVNGRRVSLRLREQSTGERRKPAGVAGATVLSYVGETIPASIRDWSFEGNTTRLDVDVVFADAVPQGAKVWVTAYWYNRKAESGPACPPVSTHIGFGTLSEPETEGGSAEAA
ncbi:MAG: hypothetical protein AAF663_09735 [Planctomycetota bacterium]